jgi:hypothetical protein
VDDRLKGVKKHPDSTLYPSELVTIGTLFALAGNFEKGVGNRR